MAEGIVLSMIITSHIGWSGQFNDVHPNISYERNGYSIGVFRNSLNHTSLYASKIDTFDGFSIQYGVANNYDGKIIPMLVFRKPIVNHVNALFMPSYDPKKGNPAMVLGLEVRY